MFAVHGNLNGSRVFRHKSRITKQVTSFRSENGIIRIVAEVNTPLGKHHKGDVGEGGVRYVSRRDFLLLTDALNRECTRELMPHNDEREDQQRLVQMMIQVAADAKQQGDPLSLRANQVARARSLPSRVAVAGVPWSEQVAAELPRQPAAPTWKTPVVPPQPTVTLPASAPTF